MNSKSVFLTVQAKQPQPGQCLFLECRLWKSLLAISRSPGSYVGAVYGTALLQNSFREEEPIATRRLNSFQLTFSVLQIPEMRQKVTSEADGDRVFQGNASVTPPPLSALCQTLPSGHLASVGRNGDRGPDFWLCRQRGRADLIHH